MVCKGCSKLERNGYPRKIVDGKFIMFHGFEYGMGCSSMRCFLTDEQIQQEEDLFEFCTEKKE